MASVNPLTYPEGPQDIQTCMNVSYPKRVSCTPDNICWLHFRHVRFYPVYLSRDHPRRWKSSQTPSCVCKQIGHAPGLLTTACTITHSTLPRTVYISDIQEKIWSAHFCKHLHSTPSEHDYSTPVLSLECRRAPLSNPMHDKSIGHRTQQNRVSGMCKYKKQG
jgi:hypothetical protein